MWNSPAWWVTRHGHAVPTARIEVMQAAHPVPDANSEIAARRMLHTVHALGPDDLVLARDLRRLGAAGAASTRADARRQTGDEQGAAGQRRHHR